MVWTTPSYIILPSGSASSENLSTPCAQRDLMRRISTQFSLFLFKYSTLEPFKTVELCSAKGVCHWIQSQRIIHVCNILFYHFKLRLKSTAMTWIALLCEACGGTHCALFITIRSTKSTLQTSNPKTIQQHHWSDTLHCERIHTFKAQANGAVTLHHSGKMHT